MKATDILGLKDYRTAQVNVPQWGVELTVREMSLDDGLHFASLMRGEQMTLSGVDIAGVVARGVIDAEGNRVFADADIPELARKNREALLELYQAIVNLSAGIEEAEKN